METLRKLLDAECSYRMKSQTMDKFLSLMTELDLKKGEPLIHYGETDNNYYILKEGIVRLVYFDGFKEITFSFALPGTVMYSYYSFVKGEPSFSKFEACCDSVVMKIKKKQFVELTRQSSDFAQWMLWMSLEQHFFHEKKLEIVNGDARERYEALLKHRPEIIEKVSDKIIASYIGITPEYLSTIKNQNPNLL